MSLRIIPCNRAQAQAAIKKWHRHHKPSVQAIFRVAVMDTKTGNVCGVATVGRPVARMLCDGKTLEINRVATDGTKNACSILIGACRRIAFELGYQKIITYTLPSEGGASLRACGWKLEPSCTAARSWDRPNRNREDDHPITVKHRWSVSRKNHCEIEPNWICIEPESHEAAGQIKLF